MRTILFAGIFGILPPNFGDPRAKPLGFPLNLVELRDESAYALTIGFIGHVNLPADVSAIGSPNRQNNRAGSRCGRGFGLVRSGFRRGRTGVTGGWRQSVAASCS